MAVLVLCGNTSDVWVWIFFFFCEGGGVFCGGSCGGGFVCFWLELLRTVVLARQCFLILLVVIGSDDRTGDSDGCMWQCWCVLKGNFFFFYTRVTPVS